SVQDWTKFHPGRTPCEESGGGMTTVRPPSTTPADAPAAAAEDASTRPARGTAQARNLSDFTALTARVKAAGLMRRAYGYYWSKLIGLTAAGLALAIVFVVIGDSWW